MKNSNPISLFSFQDIITCLTGIMIVIVLVILLQLVEALAKMTAKSELAPIYKERQLERNLLREREKELIQHLQRLKDESKKMVKAPPEDMEKNVKREEVYKKYLSENLFKTEAELKEEKEKEEQLAEKLKKEVQIEKQLKLDEKDIDLMQAEIEQLKREQQELRREYEKKKKIIRFTFAGMNDRVPLLIECHHWGFRVKTYPNGPIHFFGNKDKTIISDQIYALQRFIETFEKNNIYLVFFFHKETIPFVERITGTYDLNNYKMGKEVLEKEETCFNE